MNLIKCILALMCAWVIFPFMLVHLIFWAAFPDEMLDFLRPIKIDLSSYTVKGEGMKLKMKIWPEVIKREDGNIQSVETCYDIDLDVSPDDIKILDEATQEEYSYFIRKQLQKL